MREIKFKAWDIREKRMCVIDRLGLHGFSHDFWSSDAVICDVRQNDKERYNISQYIGKDDKYGIEIFEGDIVEDEYGRIMLVEWHNCGFCFKAITETNFVWACNITQWFEGGTPPEIIGNCYEDPNLLG